MGPASKVPDGNKTGDLRKLGSIKKISNPHRIVA